MTAASGQALRAGRVPTLAKYDVLEELGHGGMATVYRAHDKRLGRDVAVKVIHPHLRDSREVAHRFFVEAQAVAKLRHPNIVEVYDVSSEEEPEQYLVVELLRGLTLRKMLQAHGALPPEVAAAVCIELLGALAHAHAAGVVHRDIKPENVMIEHRAPRSSAPSREERVTPASTSAPGGQPSSGGGGPTSGPPTSGSPTPSVQPRGTHEQSGDRVLVKLTDFGIAKLLDAQGMTSTGQVLGSPAHMAPEQIEGGDVDGRADVFGLGVLLYECMVGHLPFEGNNPAQVLRRVLDGHYPSAERERPTVGKAWSGILDCALARNPDARFEDAAAMRDALNQELARLGVVNPRAELEAWADDPEGYVVRHTKQMIATLCDRALAARRRGDAMAAASDYNRALAYAPNDPSLLKIVVSMHRADARRRFVQRVAPLVLGTLFLGSLAFLLTRELRARLGHEDLGQRDAPPPVAVVLTADPVPLPNLAVQPKTAPSAPPVAPQPVPPRTPASAKPVERVVALSDVVPKMGVQIAVDGAPPRDCAAGDTFTLDEKAHTLVFTCRGGVCFPSKQDVEAGDKAPGPIPVHLQIKPARLAVDGEPGKTYTLREDSSIKLLAGATPNVIAMPVERAQWTVTVVELESNAKRLVTLNAGKDASVSFREPP